MLAQLAQSLNWTDNCNVKRSVRELFVTVTAFWRQTMSIRTSPSVSPNVWISSPTDVTVISVINFISVRSVELTEYLMSKDETSTPTTARDHQHGSKTKFLRAAFPQPIKISAAAHVSGSGASLLSWRRRFRNSDVYRRGELETDFLNKQNG